MKVTEQQITEAIRNVYYINLDTAVMGQNIAEQEDLVDLSRVTQCVIVMQNGYVATGESVCVCLADFDSELGQQYAYEAALDKVYAVLGYQNRTTMKEKAETAALLASLGEGECDGCKI